MDTKGVKRRARSLSERKRTLSRKSSTKKEPQTRSQEKSLRFLNAGWTAAALSSSQSRNQKHAKSLPSPKKGTVYLFTLYFSRKSSMSPFFYSHPFCGDGNGFVHEAKRQPRKNGFPQFDRAWVCDLRRTYKNRANAAGSPFFIRSG